MAMAVASGNTVTTQQSLPVPIFLPGTLIPIGTLPIPIPGVADVSNPHMGSVMLRDLATGDVHFTEEEGSIRWDDSFAFNGAQILMAHFGPDSPEINLIRDHMSQEVYDKAQKNGEFANGGLIINLDTSALSLALYVTNPNSPVLLGNNGWIDNRLPGSLISSPAYYATNYRGTGMFGLMHDKKTGIKYSVSTNEAGWDHQAVNPTADMDGKSDLAKLGVIKNMRDFAMAWHWNALFLPDGSRMIFYDIQNPERSASDHKRYAAFIRPDGTKQDISVSTDAFIDPKITGPEQTPNKWRFHFEVDGKRYVIDSEYVTANNWLRPRLAGARVSLQEGATTNKGTITLADGTKKSLAEFPGWHERVNTQHAELSAEQRQAMLLLKSIARG